ncbi:MULTISPECIES: hypothetical protein [Asticcacaulis]|jgi:hypothetical protein|uniref:hypothetical protein n=1 Tax=Asticcacaulis TaxID=76890 RepID=UPI001AE647A5|nr:MULTISPECIES: hypothetical protein [Asticcacaulis]MBP2160535.1 hypothetical protein [Asticcacaulis solisilvae]MDR6801580.1 hypothetical protein [Asticcacaulis sp. BE141]
MAILMIGLAYMVVMANLVIAGAPDVTLTIATGTMAFLIVIVVWTSLAGMGRS